MWNEKENKSDVRVIIKIVLDNLFNTHTHSRDDLYVYNSCAYVII